MWTVIVARESTGTGASLLHHRAFVKILHKTRYFTLDDEWVVADTSEPIMTRVSVRAGAVSFVKRQPDLELDILYSVIESFCVLPQPCATEATLSKKGFE